MFVPRRALFPARHALSLARVVAAFAVASAACACSSLPAGGGGTYVDGFGSDTSLKLDGLSNADGQADDATTDASISTDATADAAGGGADAADGATLDAELTDITVEADATTAGDIVDLDGFFDNDTGIGADATSSDITVGGGLAFVFAHSSDTLYRLDKNGFVKIGYFTFDKNAGTMTDIAIDKLGTLYGVTFDDLFTCESKTAKCKWIASLPESFNGLTFVPKGTVDPNDEALIGIANSGAWNHITVKGSTATVTKLGAYNGYTSSGDAFSVESIGTFATVKSSSSFGGSDTLVQVDPATGSITKVIGDTGVSDLWGFAWFGGKFYGFSDDTNVYEIDTTNAKAKIATGFKIPSGVAWYGAGVSTRAALD